MELLSVFWFRRDLRLEDNAAMYHALRSGKSVLPVFIFDTEILDDLPKDDPRMAFIFQTLEKINQKLSSYGSSLVIEKGRPIDVWKRLCSQYQFDNVFTNEDYEPYSIKRDREIKLFLNQRGINFSPFKDQVTFQKSEVTKGDGMPYTVFTPYKKQWLKKLNNSRPNSHPSEKYLHNFLKHDVEFPPAEDLKLLPPAIKVRPYNFKAITTYEDSRNYPWMDGGSYVGPYLRFGLLSIRELVAKAEKENEAYLSELIWREFFMQIIFHFPHVVDKSFKQKFDNINWLNREDSFEKWCNGNTGYPMVDAGMRELNKSGYLHNRVRMVVASFLCKHLLIDWRWGEAWFAQKLLDYELSSNNGNWQWAAGTGCDAAPYFRVFNPEAQQKKFDPNLEYIKKWVPEFGSNAYPPPMVEHSFARKRAIETYKKALIK